jgi:hypothetical protein
MELAWCVCVMLVSLKFCCLHQSSNYFFFCMNCELSFVQTSHYMTEYLFIYVCICLFLKSRAPKENKISDAVIVLLRLHPFGEETNTENPSVTLVVSIISFIISPDPWLWRKKIFKPARGNRRQLRTILKPITIIIITRTIILIIIKILSRIPVCICNSCSSFCHLEKVLRTMNETKHNSLWTRF